MLLLCRTLVRGFTARRQAVAKWRNYCTSGGQGNSWALLFDFMSTIRETPITFADRLWSGVVQMWCASNRCDHGAVGITAAMLDIWEPFSNPPYSLELVPWDCHVFVKLRKYLLTSANYTWLYCHSRGPGAASRTGLLCLPPGFGKSLGTPWKMPEQVCLQCGKIKDWCPNITTWSVFLHLPPVTYKNGKSGMTFTVYETMMSLCWDPHYHIL